jgi:hypothetical protein
MNHRPIDPPRRFAPWSVLFAVLALSAWPGLADVVETIDRGELSGMLTLENADSDLVLTDATGQTQPINLLDIDQVRFNIDPADQASDTVLLIDSDKGSGVRQERAEIRLRAGLHRVTIPYWQMLGEHRLSVTVQGPGITGRAELGGETMRCFRDSEASVEPSAGMDEEGYRLPELTLDAADDRRRMLSRARYRLYTGDDDAVIDSVASIGKLQLKRSGTTSAITTRILNTHTERVGVVFDVFFKADQDGTYTFTLASDDGARLYFGAVEAFNEASLGEPPVFTPWRADLMHDGVALGELKSIAEDSATFHIPLVSDATIAVSQIRSLWDTKLDLETVNRTSEADDLDTVYLRDKNDPSDIRSVSGKVVSLTEDALAFEFRGKERSIDRERVVGLVFRHTGRATPAEPGVYQMMVLQGGQMLPSRVQSIGKHVAFELLGGSRVTPPREVVKVMRVENGRRIDLTRITPNAEEAIPYFGVKLPHRVNTDFSGGPITLYDEETYDRGLAVHSKSRLHYKLDPNCERFQSRFGLLAPGGKLGSVTARVIGDGEVLWEQAGVTAQSGAIDVDVPLDGVERLILEVDFGEGQNVGDRAAWCQPRLIYNREATP